MPSLAGTPILNHFLFVLGLFAVSVFITGLMLRARIMDVPNSRSSHGAPVPNSGGVAIVLTFIIGFTALLLLSRDARINDVHLIGFAVAAIAIAAVSLLDDLGKLEFAQKLGAQILAAVILLAFGIVIRKISLPVFGIVELGWLAYPLTLLWVVALTNFFNFMDGLDGMAGGTGVIIALSFGLICLKEGSPFVYLLSAILFSGCLGFLVFNFPKARIFMGDVGSQFLGFAFAALAVLAAEYDASRTSFMVMPLLMFNFIFDAIFTLLRRLWRGENVTAAHRSHLYQLFNQLGYSHTQVSIFHFAVTAAQAVGAVWMLSLGPDRRMIAFLPFLLFQAVYALVLLQSAGRRKRLEV